MKSAELHAILVESTCRNIRLIEMQQENQSEDTQLSEIMHFKPQSCGHLFTVAYPGNSTNDTTSKILIIYCLLFDLFVNHAINSIGIYHSYILYRHYVINITEFVIIVICVIYLLLYRPVI